MREVFADLGVRLCARDLFAAEPHVALPGEPTLDPLCSVFQLLVGVWLEVGDDVGRAPVTGDHRRVVRLVEAGGARDVGFAAQLAGHLLDAQLRCTGPDVAGAHDRDDPGIDLAAGRGLESVPGLDGLGGRVVGAIGAHVLRDAEAACAGDRRCEHRN